MDSGIDDLFLAPGLAAVRALAHRQAVEAVVLTEVLVRAEGCDRHNIAVVQHDRVTGGIAFIVLDAVYVDLDGVEKLEAQAPIDQVGADRIINVPADLAVLIKHQVIVLGLLFDPGIRSRF